MPTSTTIARALATAVRSFLKGDMAAMTETGVSGHRDLRVAIPRPLVDSCDRAPERVAWLSQLPALIDHLARRWSLSVQYRSPFEGALLVERCYPGTPLRAVSEHEQDGVIAGLLRRMWRSPGDGSVFRPLSSMLGQWCAETRAHTPIWPDAALVEQGLAIFENLGAPMDGDVLLATDLHAANVLSAEREPWLVIDPKPFVGDRAFDATQHLLNCRTRLRSDPDATVKHFADLLEVGHERVRLWLFARVAAEPRDSWDQDSVALARMLKV